MADLSQSELMGRRRVRELRKLCYRLELKADVRTAERDHYREALRRIAYPETFVQSRSVLSRIAREALDA